MSHLTFAEMVEAICWNQVVIEPVVVWNNPVIYIYINCDTYGMTSILDTKKHMTDGTFDPFMCNELFLVFENIP